ERGPTEARGLRPPGLGGPSALAVAVAALEGCRVDHVGEAVAVAVLEQLQVQAVRLAHVGQGGRDDLPALDVGHRPLDLARYLEEPLRVEALDARVHAGDHEVLADLA